MTFLESVSLMLPLFDSWIMLITVIQLANNFGIRWQTTDKSAANLIFRVNPADGVSSWKKNKAGSLENVSIYFTYILVIH